MLHRFFEDRTCSRQSFHIWIVCLFKPRYCGISGLKLSQLWRPKERAAKPSAQDAPKICGPKTPFPALEVTMVVSLVVEPTHPKNMRKSNLDHLRQVRIGVKIKRSLSCHHLVFLNVIYSSGGFRKKIRISNHLEGLSNHLEGFFGWSSHPSPIWNVPNELFHFAISGESRIGGFHPWDTRPRLVKLKSGRLIFFLENTRKSLLDLRWHKSIKNWMGPGTNRPLSCDQAIKILRLRGPSSGDILEFTKKMYLTNCTRLYDPFLLNSRAMLQISSGNVHAHNHTWIYTYSLLHTKNIPSRELTYPTLGKGKSSSKWTFQGIC